MACKKQISATVWIRCHQRHKNQWKKFHFELVSYKVIYRECFCWMLVNNTLKVGHRTSNRHYLSLWSFPFCLLSNFICLRSWTYFFLFKNRTALVYRIAEHDQSGLIKLMVISAIIARAPTLSKDSFPFSQTTYTCYLRKNKSTRTCVFCMMPVWSKRIYPNTGFYFIFCWYSLTVNWAVENVDDKLNV